MTWKTSEGERVLGPCEAKLFFDFFDLWWDVNGHFADKKWTCPVEEPFNSLTAGQQQSVVEEVLVHLLTETTKIPKLSAANESCIYSIFQYFMDDDELESKEEIYGPGILYALEERGCSVRRGNDGSGANKGEESPDLEDDDQFWPYMGCQDNEKWNHAIEFLADNILWDRDWELPSVESNPMMMSFMRIDKDYFRKPRAKAGAKERVEKFRLARIQAEGVVAPW